MNRTCFPLASAALLVGLYAAPAAAQIQVPTSVARAPGLYVQVLDGLVSVANGGGVQSLGGGQFGYTSSFVQPPLVLPTNPGIPFTPPPTFANGVTPASAGTGAGGKPNAVDCEVR
ncbi:hypothetical protein ACFX58_10150 [Sphingomonas sp. NCPPB 2930]